MTRIVLRIAKKDALMLLALALLIWVIASTAQGAQPIGASVQYVSNSTKNISTPGSRIDVKGTITTVLLESVQQNDNWRAYVGNISASLTLDDSDNYTIFSWSLSESSITGHVFASRNDSITWASVNCSNYTHLRSEEVFLNFSDVADDNINRTFSWNFHNEFYVGDQYIQNNTCPAMATYVNDTAQQDNLQAMYEEVLLWDGNHILFATEMELDEDSYRDDNLTTYDFQILLPDEVLPSESETRYFFYIELGT